MPSLTRTTIKDESLKFQSLLEKDKFILFEFWGTWCKPCVKQIPDLEKLQQDHSDKLSIIGICHRDGSDKLKKFIVKNEMNWPQILMDEELTQYFGEVPLLPLGVLFDEKGRLIGYGIEPKDILKVLNK